MKYIPILCLLAIASCKNQSVYTSDRAINALRQELPTIVDSVIAVRTPDFIAKNVLIKIGNLIKSDSVKSDQILDSQRMLAAVTLTNRQLTNEIENIKISIVKLVADTLAKSKQIAELQQSRRSLDALIFRDNKGIITFRDTVNVNYINVKIAILKKGLPL